MEPNRQFDQVVARNNKIAFIVNILAVAVGLGGVITQMHELGSSVAAGMIGLNFLVFARDLAVSRVAKYPTLNFLFILWVHRVVGLMFIGATILMVVT